MAQQKQVWLVSVRTQVQSLASLNGLRFWRCPELCCRSQRRLRSRIACGCGVGQWLQLPIRPLAWKPPFAVGATLK